MEPTLHNGQVVWVNKLIMGPRIYTDFHFSSPNLHCVRLPGIRPIRIGDIVIFNQPYGWGGNLIGFRINSVFCKRCWGVPGDTIRITNGRFVLGNDTCSLYKQDGVVQTHNDMNDAHLLMLQDSVLLASNRLKIGKFAGEDKRWTIKEFGPIVIPKSGMKIMLDSVSRKHYAKVLAWEKRCSRTSTNKDLNTIYTFQQDWYFFVGDNLMNSEDSRYFGFVPADFVVGIVPEKKKTRASSIIDSNNVSRAQLHR